MNNEQTKLSSEQQAQKLLQEETNLIQQAQSFQQQMKDLRSKKIEMLVNIYKDKLEQQHKININNYQKFQSNEIESNQISLKSDYNQKLNKLDSFQIAIQDQIQTLNMINDDIVSKKEQLELSYLAAQNYLQKENYKKQNEYIEKDQQDLDYKVQSFRTRIEKENLF